MPIVDGGNIGIGFTHISPVKGYSKMPDFSSLLKVQEAINAEQTKLDEANKKADPGLQALMNKWMFQGLESEVGPTTEKNTSFLVDGYNKILDYFNQNASLAVASPEFQNLLTQSIKQSSTDRNTLAEKKQAFDAQKSINDKLGIGDNLSLQSITQPGPTQNIKTDKQEVTTVDKFMTDRSTTNSWMDAKGNQYDKTANFGQLVSDLHNIYNAAKTQGGSSEFIANLNQYVKDGLLDAGAAATIGTLTTSSTSNAANIAAIQKTLIQYLDKSQLNSLYAEYIQAPDGANAIQLDSDGKSYISNDVKSKYFSGSNATPLLDTEAKNWFVLKAFGKDGVLSTMDTQGLNIPAGGSSGGGSSVLDKYNRDTIYLYGRGNVGNIEHIPIADANSNGVREVQHKNVNFVSDALTNVLAFNKASNTANLVTTTGNLAAITLTPEQQSKTFVVGTSGKGYIVDPIGPTGVFNESAPPVNMLTSYVVTNGENLEQILKTASFNSVKAKNQGVALMKIIDRNIDFGTNTNGAAVGGTLPSSTIYNKLKELGYKDMELYGITNDAKTEINRSDLQKMITTYSNLRVSRIIDDPKYAGWNISDAMENEDENYEYGKKFLENLGIKKVNVSDGFDKINKQGYATYSNGVVLSANTDIVDDKSISPYNRNQLTQYKTFLDNEETNNNTMWSDAYVYILPMAVDATPYVQQAMVTDAGQLKPMDKEAAHQQKKQ